MKFTDGKKSIELIITDNNSGIDVTADLMEVGTMEYDEELNAYKVEYVDYCAEYARSEFAEDNVEVIVEEL